MNLYPTKHFLLRIDERKWDWDEIENIILYPDKVEYQEDGKVKYIKFDGVKYYHVVVARKDNNTYILITYYKTSKELI
jgi:hypothetical protein